MTGDDRLQTELETLERAAPDATPPIADGRPPRRWLGVGLVGATVVVAAAVTLVALGPLRSLPLGAVSPSPNPPARAETHVGDFILTVQSPQTMWTTDQPIDLAATLRYVGEEGEVTLGGGGIGISLIQQTGGDGELIAAFLGICRDDLYTISPDAPLNVPYQKGGVVNDVGPFDEAFFRDPELRLPPGRWLVIADANLGVDGCDGLDLEVSLEIEVVEADGSPAPAPNPPAVAETRVGDFILTISSPKTVWTTQQEIEVSASLSYVGSEPDMTIGEGAPPIGFTITSASGQGATVGTGHFRPCIQYPVRHDRPLVATLTKDGILVEEGVPAASPFGQTFSANPDLELEPGEWEFTASTTFAERTCGNDYELEASIVLEVADAHATEQPAPSSSAAPTASPVAGEVEMAGVHVTLPPGWDARPPERAQFCGPHIIAGCGYFWISNQPMQSDCVGTSCQGGDFVIPELKPGGVLMSWEVIIFRTPDPDRRLPAGTPTRVGGFPAVVREEGCDGRQEADFASHLQVMVGASTTVQLYICGRDIGDKQQDDIARILKSVRFNAALTPSASPPPG